MSRYVCAVCGEKDESGWTYYYSYLAMGIPPVCHWCDPNQRCHWHNDAARRAQDEADVSEVAVEDVEQTTQRPLAPRRTGRRWRQN